MATALIESGACMGAMAAFIAGRGYKSAVVNDYAGIAASAESLADEVAASAAAVSLADADNATNMSLIVATITYALLMERNFTASTTDSDYASIAAVICAAAKAAAPVV